MTFQVGDKVIYPNHGLGIVERIEEKTILGTTCAFYHLRIIANETTVLVPLTNADGVGLRRAITDQEARISAADAVRPVRVKALAGDRSRSVIPRESLFKLRLKGASPASQIGR